MCRTCPPTISLGDTGAFSASAISCAFWLTLAFRVRIVLKASLRLFCLPCFVVVVVVVEEEPGAALFARPYR